MSVRNTVSLTIESSPAPAASSRGLSAAEAEDVCARAAGALLAEARRPAR